MYQIYKITNKINGKIYIGQTVKSIETRMNEHFLNADLNKKFYLSKAIRKFGKESFAIESIDYAYTKKDINEKEMYWIKYYKSNNRLYGYNMTNGGEGGNTYLLKTTKEMGIISEKISKGLRGGNNGNSTSINMKNIINDEVIHFDSCIECEEYLLREFGNIPSRVYLNNAYKNKKYGIQTIFNEKYVFYFDEDGLGRITNYKSCQGKMPHIIENLKTGEKFVGISKDECLDYFDLSKYKNKYNNIDVTKYGFIMRIYKGNKG